MAPRPASSRRATNAVTTWTLPVWPRGTFFTALVVWAYTAFWSGAPFQRSDSYISAYVFFGNEALRTFFAVNHMRCFYALLALHVVEAVVMDVTRLRPYRVRRFTGVWWLWIAGVLTEGYGAFLRLDSLAAGANDTQ